MTIPDETVEAMRQAQSAVILSVLEDWLRAAPGREVRMRFDGLLGFRVALHDLRESRGESLRDAAAQVTTVLLVDGGAP